MIRVVFAGTPGFSVPCLNALMASPDVEVVGVVSQPDRRAGRGMKLMPSPVKQAAIEYGLDVLTPERLVGDGRPDERALQWLQEKRPDVLVVVAFGMILPRAWLQAPRIAPINVHASLLPRWRGAAPIERAMLAGDEKTGVCIMHMEEGLDTGPVYARREISITPDMLGQDLWHALSKLGAELLVEVLPGIVAGDIKPVPQPEDGVCYAQKIRNEERVIDWSRPAMLVDRQVRCFAPKPGARTRLNGRWLKVIAGSVVQKHALKAEPGTIVCADDALVIACGDSSAYRIGQVQPEGKKPMSAADFLRGAHLSRGMRCE